MGILPDTFGAALGAAKSFIASLYVTQAEAEAGTKSTGIMTPLRTAQAITAQASSGGGMAVYDATVSTEGALQTAITAGGRILVDTSIALAAELDLPASTTPVWIDLADGVTITAPSGNSNGVFNAASTSYDLTLGCGRDAEFRSAGFNTTVVAGTVNNSPTSFLRGSLRLAIDSGTWLEVLQDAGRVTLDLDRLEVEVGAVEFDISANYGSRCEVLKATGIGTSSRMSLEDGHFGTVFLDGSWRGGSAFGSNDVTLFIANAVTVDFLAIDPNSSAETGWLISVSGNLLGGQGPVAGTYISVSGQLRHFPNAVVQPLGDHSSSIEGLDTLGGIVPNTSSPSLGGTLRQCVLSSNETVDLDGTVGLQFEDCEFGANLTLTIPSGSRPRFEGCTFGTGTITIDAGADALLESCDMGSVTITNNDPGTIIRNSTDVADDTVPETRRFGNATLDAILDKLILYADFTETDLNFGNKAPRPLAGDPSPFAGDPSLVTTGPDGAGIDLDATSKDIVAALGALPIGARGEFTFNIWHAPDDSTPATVVTIAGARPASGTGAVAAMTTGGIPYLYANGGTRITGASKAFNDTTMSMVTWGRRRISGTLTYFLYVDGVEIGTSTTAVEFALTPEWELVLGSGNRSLNESSVGDYAAWSVWSKGLTPTEIAELYNSGTGRFLEGAGL